MITILKYLKKNILISLMVFYGVVSSLLFSFTSIDICVPCFWKKILGFNCPGCGLTRAFSCLVHFDIVGAFEMNPLIFIVVPAISYYIISDYIKFYKNGI